MTNFRKAAEMIKDATDCSHGEIFWESFRIAPIPDQDFIDFTDEIRGDPTWDDDGTLFAKWNQNDERCVITTVSRAIEFWKEYFQEFPSHGEYAGLVTGMLFSMERFDKVCEILTICGQDGFGWDS